MADIKYPSKSTGGYDAGTTPCLIFRAYFLKNDQSDRGFLAGTPAMTYRSAASESLVLPIPIEGLSTEESQDWQEETDLASDLLKAGSAMFLEKLTKTTMIGNIKWLESVNEVGAVNDLASLLYKLSAMRTFNFSWNLVPENKEDAKSINEIIDRFRVLSYGSSSAPDSIAVPTNIQNYFTRGIFIMNPPLWSIEAVFGGKVFYYTDWCALTNVKVTRKGGDKAFTLMNDGGIPQQQLDISFKELFRHTRESIDRSQTYNAI